MMPSYDGIRTCAAVLVNFHGSCSFLYANKLTFISTSNSKCSVMDSKAQEHISLL